MTEKIKKKESMPCDKLKTFFFTMKLWDPPQPPTPHVRVKINYIESWLAKDPQGANQTHTKKEEEMEKKTNSRTKTTHS